MSTETPNEPGTVIPTFRYRDAEAAIDWLCDVLAFERHLVVPGDDGAIAHAQLTIGGGMIMLGSAQDGDFDSLTVTPERAGGVTQSSYIVIADIDAHYERAKAAGAEIVMEIADQDYGGRLYSCRDPEGHLWNFGSYDPWA
ncbi:MAG: VOC family protein [Pseudomonadota bacterium]